MKRPLFFLVLFFVSLMETSSAMPGQGWFYADDWDECTHTCPDGVTVVTSVNNCLENLWTYCVRAKCPTYTQTCL